MFSMFSVGSIARHT